MKYLNWFIRLVLFLVLLGFSLRNDTPVVVRYFFGYEWHTSLVLVLLVFFAAGVAIGMIALLGVLLRLRREVSALNKKISLLQHEQAGEDE